MEQFVGSELVSVKSNSSITSKSIDTPMPLESDSMEKVRRVSIQLEQDIHSIDPHSPVEESKSPKHRSSIDKKLPQLTKNIDPMVQDMHETIKILQLKIGKLEDLVRLKDTKIQELNIHLQQLQQQIQIRDK